MLWKNLEAYVVEALHKLLFTFEGLDKTSDPEYVVHFTVGCWIVGIAVLILDLCFLSVRGKSLLQLRHSPIRSLVLFVTWPVGAAIFGWAGVIAHMLQPSVLGTLASAFTWSTSVHRLASLGTHRNEPEEDVEEGEDE